MVLHFFCPEISFPPNLQPLSFSLSQLEGRNVWKCKVGQMVLLVQEVGKSTWLQKLEGARQKEEGTQSVFLSDDFAFPPRKCPSLEPCSQTLEPEI